MIAKLGFLCPLKEMPGLGTSNILPWLVFSKELSPVLALSWWPGGQVTDMGTSEHSPSSEKVGGLGGSHPYSTCVCTAWRSCRGGNVGD